MLTTVVDEINDCHWGGLVPKLEPAVFQCWSSMLFRLEMIEKMVDIVNVIVDYSVHHQCVHHAVRLGGAVIHVSAISGSVTGKKVRVGQSGQKKEKSNKLVEGLGKKFRDQERSSVRE